MSTAVTMEDAFFAGRVFVPGERDEFRFFLWGDGSATYAEPADGAFLCKVSAGWIFVAGKAEYQNFRHTFTDDSLEAEENAKAMAALGIQILSFEDGNQRVRADGIAIYSITDDEKRRLAALEKRLKKS